MPWAAVVLSCLIVGVPDGDTLRARCSDAAAPPVKIRLVGIDAPERRQAFGQRSRRALMALCAARVAEVRPVAARGGKDRYGRTLAQVRCGEADAGVAQLRAGLAWAYDRDAPDPTLLALEREARQARRGLWQDRSPVPPWQWRAQRRPD